jgi:hypothetical protein
MSIKKFKSKQKQHSSAFQIQNLISAPSNDFLTKKSIKFKFDYKTTKKDFESHLILKCVRTQRIHFHF